MIKSVNNFSKKKFPTLPINGWLKPCYCCESITSSYIIKKANKITLVDLKYYFCATCIRKKKYKTTFQSTDILESNKMGVLV